MQEKESSGDMKRFLLMLQFTTRIPIPLNLRAEEEDFQKGMKLFPFIGFLIGIVLWVFYKFVFMFDPLVAAVGVVLIEIVITGGLHQDGLGDTFDGLFSNRTGDKMLEVMKDSCLGTHGVLVITGVLLLKTALINAIADPVVLLGMSVFSRLSMVFGSAFSRSARKEGLGCMFIEGVDWKDALFSGLLAGILVFKFIGVFYAAIIEGVLLATAMLFIKLMDKKIGGMTGDTLGALEEISSLAFLFVYIVLNIVN